MSMLKTITNTLRDARDVIHGARMHARETAGIVEPKISSVFEAARALPALWLEIFQLALAALVSHERKEVLAAEQDLSDERLQERRDRKAREKSKKKLYQLLIKARTFLEAALERGAATLVGLNAGLGKLEALALVRYGVLAHRTLSQPDFAAEALVIDGKVYAPQDYAEEVREATEELQELEDRLADQVRRTEQKLRAKEEAMASLGKCTMSCSRILEELYSLAGRKFHAERLRTGSRTRSAPHDDPVLLDEHNEATPLNDDDSDPVGVSPPPDLPGSQDEESGEEGEQTLEE